jgi:hypothetical protein
MAKKKSRTKQKKEVNLSRRQLARYKCNDCPVNVVTAGEFYILKPEIWEGQLKLGWSDNLCIGCLEKRLGRKISWRDMGWPPIYPWTKPMSIRFLHRFLGENVTKRPPYRWRKSFLKTTGGFTKANAKAIGEYGAREATAYEDRVAAELPIIIGRETKAQIDALLVKVEVLQKEYKDLNKTGLSSDARAAAFCMFKSLTEYKRALLRNRKNKSSKQRD